MYLLSSFRLIYLVGSAFALFFSFLIFSKKIKTLADKILGSWLVVLFAQLVIPAIYLSDLNLNYKYAGIEIVFYVFHPLFLYLYVKAMLGKLIKWKFLIWNILVVVVYEVLGLSFFMIPAEERLLMIEGKEMLPLIFIPFIVMMAVYFVYYIYYSYKLLKDFKDNVLQIYSYRENVDLLWLRRLLVVFASISVLIFPIGFISYYGFHSMAFTDYFFFIALVVFVFLLGFWGYQQGEIFNFNSSADLNTSDVHVLEQVSENHSVEKHYKEEAKQLKNLMSMECLYLNPSLSIHDLADRMHMPAHLLSKVINKEFHCNFFEFINRYRIEEFKKRAFDPEYKNLTILAVALDCGFNSKSAFNRIFKDITGLTPGSYIKNHR